MFVVAASTLGLGCESPATSSGYSPYTAVYVDPADFLGEISCNSVDGAMKSYVATLYDVSDGRPDSILTVVSSPPTSCHSPVAFSQIVPGHFYTVSIDGYDLPACPFGHYEDGCLAPADGWGSGTRTVVLANGNALPPISAYASPSWMTHCGRLPNPPADGTGGQTDFYSYDPLGPTEAVYLTSSRINGCESLTVVDGPARVILSAETLRGGLNCGKNPGQISKFEVQSSKDSAPKSIDCGAEVRYENLPPDINFNIKIFAFESGSSGPRWGSQCFARTKNGQTLAASCDGLSERGSLLLSGAGSLCSDASSYRATVVGLNLPAQSALCPTNLLFSGLPSGVNDLWVERKDSTGNTLGTALCSGFVLPGQQAATTCSF